MKYNLCPSMMCARIGNLDREIELLEDAGADVFHLDIMDGHYVPNFAMGIESIKYICENSKIQTEIHMMVENPGDYIELMARCGVDTIYIHPESEYHSITTLQRIKELGIEPGIVINPGTSVESIVEILNVVRKVLVMGVNPGQAGQIYLKYAENKISKLISYQKEFDFSIGMDGACSIENIPHLYNMGVENFVLGTAALFNGDYDYAKKIALLRETIKNENCSICNSKVK